MPFSSDVLTLETDGPVSTLWLDAPERRNACGPAFFADLPRAFDALSSDEMVRAVVLAARGPSFTVGLDLKAMAPLLLQGPAAGPDAGHRRDLYLEIKRLQAAINAVAACPKPVIAAVQGHCIGAGMDLITACDIRLAAEDASFSVRETKMAIVADLGTLQRLPRIVAAGHAAELIYTGADFSAARAHAVGLVNAVYPDHEALMDAALALGAEIAANSPLAVQGAKAVLHATAYRTVEDGLDYVALWNTSFLRSRDLHEAVTAFLEKRPPRFEGA